MTVEQHNKSKKTTAKAAKSRYPEEWPGQDEWDMLPDPEDLKAFKELHGNTEEK